MPDVHAFTVPPMFSKDDTRYVTTSTGDNVTLECNAKGYPEPKISWRRKNNVLLPTGGTIYRGNILNIFNVSRNDSGNYYCVAYNPVGTAVKIVSVEVECKCHLYLCVRGGSILQYCTLEESAFHFQGTKVKKRKHYGAYRCYITTCAKHGVV